MLSSMDRYLLSDIIVCLVFFIRNMQQLPIKVMRNTSILLSMSAVVHLQYPCIVVETQSLDEWPALAHILLYGSMNTIIIIIDFFIATTHSWAYLILSYLIWMLYTIKYIDIQ